jgi:ferrous iron transport protein A
MFAIPGSTLRVSDGRPERKTIEAVPSGSAPTGPRPTRLLSDLAEGAIGVVERVTARSGVADAALLHRLSEIGFIAGEPVRLLRRGPGGREPIAVQVGDTMFALRLVEAQCIEITVQGDHG